MDPQCFYIQDCGFNPGGYGGVIVKLSVAFMLGCACATQGRRCQNEAGQDYQYALPLYHGASSFLFAGQVITSTEQLASQTGACSWWTCNKLILW
jgi:hypothetical protein